MWGFERFSEGTFRDALPAQSQIRNELPVPFQIFVLQVVQQPAALAHLQQQAATAVMVFLMNLQMLGQLIDRSGQNGDLHVGRSGVGSRTPEFGGDLRFLFFAQGHVCRDSSFKDGLASGTARRAIPATGASYQSSMTARNPACPA